MMSTLEEAKQQLWGFETSITIRLISKLNNGSFMLFHPTSSKLFPYLPMETVFV